MILRFLAGEIRIDPRLFVTLTLWQLERRYQAILGDAESHSPQKTNISQNFRLLDIMSIPIILAVQNT